MGFILSPAQESDCEAIIRLQFEACAEDPGFSVIFPRGATAESIATFTKNTLHDMRKDPSYRIIKLTDAETGQLASFAIWHFLSERSQDEVDSETLTEDFHLPSDANIKAGDKMIRNGLRKRNEVMGGKAYACMIKLPSLSWMVSELILFVW